MNSRTILEQTGLSIPDLLQLCTSSMAEWTLNDLQFMLMHCEMEIQYRQDFGLLSEESKL